MVKNEIITKIRNRFMAFERILNSNLLKFTKLIANVLKNPNSIVRKIAY